MFIFTATNRNFGNTNIIKANINKDQVNVGKWSYIKTMEPPVDETKCDKEQDLQDCADRLQHYF